MATGVRQSEEFFASNAIGSMGHSADGKFNASAESTLEERTLEERGRWYPQLGASYRNSDYGKRAGNFANYRGHICLPSLS